MSRAKRIGLNRKYYCKCTDGAETRLSKRKQEFLRKIRTGVQERVHQKPPKPPKVAKEGNPVKKPPVKHYVNLPGWVVRNLIDLCKKKAQDRNKAKSKNPPQEAQSMESVKEKPKKEKPSPKKNMENEQVPGEVMEIKREMATT